MNIPDLGPNGQMLAASNPADEVGPRQCVGCHAETEDGSEVELVEGELECFGKPVPAGKGQWLCESCIDDREGSWGNDGQVAAFGELCEELGVDGTLEPMTRLKRASDAIAVLERKASALEAYLTIADKVGLLMQGNLDENPYCFIVPGPESHGKEILSESPQCIVTRALVKAASEDPDKWERDQLLKRAMNAKQSLRDLYWEREHYDKGHLGYQRNLWAIPRLEALVQKTMQELGAIIMKRSDLM